MSRQLKIAITNATFAGNKGAEAMLFALIENLHNNFNNVVIYTEKELRASNIDSINENIIQELRDRSIDITSYQFKPRLILKYLFFGYSNDNGKINPDLIIDISGLSFSDMSVRGSVRSLLKQMPYILRGKPTLYFTQDFGPMSKASTRLFAKLVLGRAKAIFVRSKSSYDFLSLIINTKKILGPFPDSTLVLEPDGETDQVSDEPYILLSPSSVMYNKHGKLYLEYFAGLIEELKNQNNIVIMNHSYGSTYVDSDGAICETLHKQFPETILINKNIKTKQLKKIISGANFVVSSRYHVIVAALSCYVPAIAVGWNPKYISFLKLYDVPQFNLEFNSSILENSMKLLTEKNLDEAKERIKKKNPLLKEEVKKSFEILNSKIREQLS